MLTVLLFRQEHTGLSGKVNQILSGGLIPLLHSDTIGPEGGLFLPRGSVRILFLLNSCLQHIPLRSIPGMHHDDFPSYVQMLQNVPDCQKLTHTREINNASICTIELWRLDHFLFGGDWIRW